MTSPQSKRLRLGYLAIIVVTFAFLAGGWWDAAYNGQNLRNWIVVGMVGFGVVASLYVVSGRMRPHEKPYRSPPIDQLVRPSMQPDRAAAPTAGVLDLFAQPATQPLRSPAGFSPAPAMPSPPVVGVTANRETPPGAPETPVGSFAERVLEKNAAGNEAAPVKNDTDDVRALEAAAREGAAPTSALASASDPVPGPADRQPDLPPARVGSEPFESRAPTISVTVLPKNLEPVAADYSRGPRPPAFPPPPRGIVEQSLAFEWGNHQFRPPVAQAHSSDVWDQPAVRILCSACGLYFQAHVDTVRPVSVPCPRCVRPLGLVGGAQLVTHVKLRCRFCGDFMDVPKLVSHTATQCSTCGQITG